jgi:transposase
MAIILSDYEKAELKKIHSSLSDGRERDRIKVIFLLDKGYSSTKISEILLIDLDTITKWKKAFEKKSSLYQWFESDYKAYKGKLTDSELKQVSDFVEENLITDSKKVSSFIKETFDKTYSKSAICKLLGRLGFSYKNTVLVPSKYDASSQESFNELYLSLLENLSSDDAIGFVDGVHPQHNTKSSKAWIKKGCTKEIKSNSGRQRININGFYNAETQEIIWQEDEKLNKESTISFFKKVESFYKDKSRVYLIVDNAKYYRNKDVLEYIDGSKLELIFLPTYSPNLNLIERLWKLLRKKVINNKYYEKFKDFRNAIYDFFDSAKYMKPELLSFIGTKLHLFPKFSENH